MAAETTKIKSSKSAVLLNVGTAAAADYKRIGKGVTSLPISYNPKTTTETYVDEDNAQPRLTATKFRPISSRLQLRAIRFLIMSMK